MSPPDNSEDDHKPAGRVRHDSTGRAVWEWASESGRQALDSTSRLLKRLELPGLMLDEDAKKKREEERAEAALKEAGKRVVPTFGGPREQDPLAHGKQNFNPYDNRTPVKKVAPKPAQKTLTKPTEQEKRPGFFARMFGGK